MIGISNTGPSYIQSTIKFDFEELKPILWEQKYSQDKIVCALNTISSNLIKIPSAVEYLRNVTLLISKDDGELYLKVIKEFDKKLITGDYSHIIRNCSVEIDYSANMCRITPFYKEILVNKILTKYSEVFLDPNDENYFKSKEIWDGELVFKCKKIGFLIKEGTIGINLNNTDKRQMISYGFNSLSLVK